MIYEFTVESALVASAAPGALLRVSPVAVSPLAWASSTEAAHACLALAPDGFLLAGDPIPGQVLGLLLDDLLGLLAAPQDVAALWECIVFTGAAFNPSVYSGFDFTSFCNFDGYDYGVKDDGVYILSGADDDGVAINTGIIFPATAFGTANRKKFRKAFIGAGGVNMKFSANTDTGERVFVFDRGEVALRRDMYGARWQFKVGGFDFFDFIEIFPITLTR